LFKLKKDFSSLAFYIICNAKTTPQKAATLRLYCFADACLLKKTRVGI
jgi:hypothetical protein